ncbi:copia protein [Tanacetum coccineum]
MSEPMPTIPTQSPFTYPIPNSSASPSFTQDDTFMPNPIQPMPTFTHLTTRSYITLKPAFSQPAFSHRINLLYSPPAVHEGYMEGVKARFGGNEESKKMRKTMLKQQFTEFSVTEEEGLHKGYDRFQKILSQLNQVQARPDNDDINLKFLRALPSSWSQVGLALKTRGGLDSMSFDDLYNKLRSLELDVRIGHSYSVKAAVAPTHSAFIGTACSGSKPTYSDQQRIVPSVSQTSGRSDNVMECVLHSFVAENEQDQDMIYEDFDQVDQLEMEEMDLKWQMAMLSLRINRFEKKAGRKMNYNNQQPARFDRRKVRCYKCLQLGHFARECNVKTVDDKARYSAFKVTEVKTDEPKALVSVDSMVNWSDHAAENKTDEVAKVYGMMAGLHADNSGAGISNAADEFAMMGISPKVQNCPLGCDSKINDLNTMYNNLDRLYNDCYIKVQAYQHAVKTLESQKDWYHKTQMALEEKIRVLSANLENTTNTLSYTEKLHDQAQKEKKEWEVKFEATLARFEKWKESSKNLKKLIDSSMSTRTKIGLGFQEYFGVDEVFDLSTPSVFYSDPVEKEDKPLYSRFVKAGEMHAVPPPITGTYMPSPYQSDIEETQVSYGSKSDNKTSETISESNDFVSCDNSDKSSDSETHASCDSSLKTQTKDIPPAVDIQTLPESDVENSTTGSPSFSCSENVKSPRIICNKSGVNNRKVCKNNFVRVKKCFVCGSKLHLIKDCDFYNCVDSVPCKFKAASVPAGSRNSSASVPADRSDPAASRNRPAVNPADRPHPAGWSKRPATVSAGRPVSAGWLNPAARPFFRPSSVYNTNWSNIYDPMIKGRWGTAGDPEYRNDIGIVEQWLAQRSMTKGTRKNFEDFKIPMPDASQVVLRIPRNIISTHSTSQPATKNKRKLAKEEFKNAKLIELCGEKGIKRDYSNPRTPQQNGVAERKNRTLIEAARTMLADSNYLPCKADDGYLVGYASNSKAYRVYNLPNKRVEETLNLRFLEDKPNVQGIGHEWYFDLDYLTDSLGYTRFKTDTPAGTHETNINAGTQDHDSDSEVDEQVIVVPSFPSNRFAGPSSSNGPRIMERNADYAEELAKLQRQEYEAKDAAARYGYLFSQATAEILCQAEAGILLALILLPSAESNPAVSSSVSAEFHPVYADESTLPPDFHPVYADVNEDNFIERMTAIKERKKRALAELRYRALKGMPLKQSEVTKMMRNLVKNQWCAAHNGTITMKAVTAMSKQQLTEEYENICRRLEKDHLLSAQYNLFRPKPALTEPPSKRQRVERASSQPSDVPAATTQPADDPDSAGGSSFHPAGSTPMSGSAVPDTAGGTLGTTGTASTVPTSAAMDSAASHHELGISPFADSDNSSSPSPVSTDHIPIDVLFEPTPGGINAFFLDSDEDEQIGLSRVAAEPDSDDEVLAEILFRGQYVSGAGVVVVDKLPDDEIVDPRVKVEPISESTSSPPRSRSKHRGVRSDTSLWDRPVDDFLSSESESDDDIEDYIPPIPYGAFKDWEIVRCPLRNTYYHVYYQENRRHKNFFYLKELLPHVYREDLLLLRRRMNRRLAPIEKAQINLLSIERS